MNVDEYYLNRAAQLAEMGRHKVCPNPLVGCVIVHKNLIISEGFHQAYGEPHAEVNAIEQVSEMAVLMESIVYVTLEPCSHFGKTPPCADLLISKKVKKVVIGSLDPNPEVNGRGAQKLRDAGINVEVLNHLACTKLNQKFNFYHTYRKTYITLKWAETSDGFLGRLPNDNGSKKISDAVNQIWVHKLRSEHHAILIGTQTAILDNPKLNNRKWIGRSPLVMVLDENLTIPLVSHLFNSERVIIFNSKVNKIEKNIEYRKINFPLICQEFSEVLYQLGIQSVLVEGGAKVLQTFIDWNLWNDIFISLGNENWYKGVKSPNRPKNLSDRYNIGTNSILYYQNK